MGKIINQKDEDGDFEISYLKKSVKDPSRDRYSGCITTTSNCRSN
jgi:hypothetical protein